MGRYRRIDLIGRFTTPLPRFWGGIAALPAFLLTDRLLPRGILLLLFGFLAVLAGKKIRWTYFATLILSVAFFHLLAPWGRILIEIGPWPITAGALENGLLRGFGLVGMVFLSVAAVRPELVLPGRFGGLLGRTFYHFDRIVEGRKRLRRTDFLASLDELLLERFDPGEKDFVSGIQTDLPPGAAVRLPALGAAGWILVAAGIPWLVWILGRLEII